MPVMSAVAMRGGMMRIAAAGIAAALGVLAARPAAAINCQAAATRQEKAICTDPAAKSADERMAEAFGGLNPGARRTDPSGESICVAGLTALPSSGFASEDRCSANRISQSASS